MLEVLRVAQDFACGLPLAPRQASLAEDPASLTPAQWLKFEPD
jgi:hypothetical protein